MKVAISSIAWPLSVEASIATKLVSWGAEGVELAPTRWWPHPTRVDQSEWTTHREFWRALDLPVVAIQAIFFGRPDLLLFDDATTQATVEHGEGMLRVAADLGADVVVFGSPKNRLTGGRDKREIERIEIQAFRALARRGRELGVWFCIEPNPVEYGCDYITRATEAIELVQRIDAEGFGLHLDAGALALAQEDPFHAVRAAGQWLRHFHVSEPYLEAVGSRGSTAHERFADALLKGEYQGWCSIEMRAPGEGEVDERVRSALALAASVYGGKARSASS